jgi:hypothetical protein
LGIVSIFKGATTFDSPHDFALKKAAGATAAAAATEQRPSAEGRLRRLQQLRANKTISEEEYNRYELEILREQ